jgi:hypothetical protein
LLQKNSKKQTFLYNDNFKLTKNLTEIIIFVLTKFGASFTKELIFSVDFKENNLLHFYAENLSICVSLIEFVKEEHFELSQQKMLLFSRDYEGTLAIEKVIIKVPEWEYNLELLNSLLNIVDEIEDFHYRTLLRKKFISKTKYDVRSNNMGTGVIESRFHGTPEGPRVPTECAGFEQSASLQYEKPIIFLEDIPINDYENKWKF